MQFKKQKDLADHVARLVMSPKPDDEVLLDLEVLARGHHGLLDGVSLMAESAIWGPALYARNRVHFRRFIVNHLSSWHAEHVYKGVWKKNEGRLEEFLDAVDRDGDSLLFRRLYAWKISTLSKGDAQRTFEGDLLPKFQAARSKAERSSILAKYPPSYPATLNEDLALELYRIDRESASSYIRENLPYSFQSTGRIFRKPKKWDRLTEATRVANDDVLFSTLYRRQTTFEEWSRDILHWAREIRDADDLVAKLRDFQPHFWNEDTSAVYISLLEQRGADVFPFIVDCGVSSFNENGWMNGPKRYQKIIKLCDSKGWTGFRNTMVRLCAKSETWNKEVLAVVESSSVAGDEKEDRLRQLAGVAREWNFPGVTIARIHALEDKVAAKIATQHPALLRGIFRQSLVPDDANVYTDTLNALLNQGDDHTIDQLAAKLATVSPWGRKAEQWQRVLVPWMNAYKGIESEDGTFADRAGRVLGNLPAYTIWDFKGHVTRNPLARLLFMRSTSYYLRGKSSIRDMLESPQIHVQILAWRALSLDSDQAREAGAANVDLLASALLRPLHRKTRLHVFAALENAGRHREDVARHILEIARTVTGLPPVDYPSERVIGLIGRLQNKWPRLRPQSKSNMEAAG